MLPILTLKSTTFAVLILVCNLHSIDAATCRIPQPGRIPALGGTGGDVYSLLSAANEACTAACTTCGQTACTAVRAANALAGITLTNGGQTGTTGANGCPTMQQLGAEICPTISFAAPTTGGAAGESFFQSVTAMTFGPQATTGIDFAATYAAEIQGFSNVVNTPTVLGADQAGLLTAAAAGQLTVCPCQGPVTTTCPVCGCNDFGMPTSAPTAIPTTAPTAASSTTDLGSTFTSTSSDDSLSGGAIAGIVIGSVVGAALVIGAGVMIGSSK